MTPEDQSDSLLGTVIGSKYRVRKVLGAGGMGAVYLALNEDLGRTVALKMLHGPLAADKEFAARFRAEAWAAAAIRHPGIVDVLDLGTTEDGKLFIVMEHLLGLTLRACLARQCPFSVGNAAWVLDELLDALGAAHERGIVHRDLKPENVFLAQTPKGVVVKLLDFGLSKSALSDLKLTHSGTSLGTPLYMAPEQAKGAKHANHRADLYSVGAMLYELLTGRPPFTGDSYAEILSKLLGEPHLSLTELRPDLPLALSHLVDQLLAKNPEERPSSARVVRAALKAALPPDLEADLDSMVDVEAGTEPAWRPPATRAGVPTAPRPETKPVSQVLELASSLPVPARSKGWVVAAALALAALGGVGVLWFSRSPPSATSDPVDAEVAKALAAITSRLDGGVAAGAAGDTAVDHLLAAQRAFPQRREWLALEGTLVVALQREIQRAIASADVTAATQHLSFLAQLQPLAPDDSLKKEVERLVWALDNGMVPTGMGYIDRYEHPNRAGRVPTTEVSFADAVELCRRQKKHLCTAAEWQAACRGVDGKRCLGRSSKAKSPSPSGAHAACVSETGVFDLSGNVAEWTNTARDNGSQMLILGGSFFQSDAKLACDAKDYRGADLPGTSYIGFRCCL